MVGAGCACRGFMLPGTEKCRLTFGSRAMGSIAALGPGNAGLRDACCVAPSLRDRQTAGDEGTEGVGERDTVRARAYCGPSIEHRNTQSKGRSQGKGRVSDALFPGKDRFGGWC